MRIILAIFVILTLTAFSFPTVQIEEYENVVRYKINSEEWKTTQKEKVIPYKNYWYVYEHIQPSIIEEKFSEIPNYRTEIWYNTRDVFMYNTQVYEVIQRHKLQKHWKPTKIPALYKQKDLSSIGILQQWEQPQGSHDCYDKEAKVLYNGKTWENTVECNVWQPGVYGWNQI